MDEGTTLADSASGTSASDSTGGTSTNTSTSTSTSDGSGSSETGEPLICTDVYKPVCGRDGETYDHPCDVPRGVGIRRNGPCFGDCEESCAVLGSPSSSALLVVLAFLAIRRRRTPGGLRRC